MEKKKARTYSDMLVSHEPDGLQRTAANGILRRRFGLDVAEINGWVYPGTTRRTSTPPPAREISPGVAGPYYRNGANTEACSVMRVWAC